jgi:hypothetical protein
MELATIRGSSSSGGLSLAAISAVFTIRYVPNLLGEDEDWLHELSIDMFPGDGGLSVYGVSEDGVPPSRVASNTCSRSSLTKQPPAAQRRRSNQPHNPACGFHRMLTRELQALAVL